MLTIQWTHNRVDNFSSVLPFFKFIPLLPCSCELALCAAMSSSDNGGASAVSRRVSVKAMTSPDAAAATEKRRGATDELRKQFRNEHIGKRRKGLPTSSSSDSISSQQSDDSQPHSTFPASETELTALLTDLRSAQSSPASSRTGTLTQLKQLLAHPDAPITWLVGQSLIDLLLAELHNAEQSSLVNRVEAVWCLVNIAADSYENAARILPASSTLIAMLGQTSTVQLQELAAWTLGNLAADDQATRAALLAHGVISPLVQLYNAQHSQQRTGSELLRIVAWALSNLFKTSGIDHTVLQSTPFLSNCYVDWTGDDSQLAVEVSWVLSHLSSQPVVVQQLLVERGLLESLRRKLERMQLATEGTEQQLQLERSGSDDVQISTGETTATLALPSTNVPAATYLPILRIIGHIAGLPQSPIVALFSIASPTPNTDTTDGAPSSVLSPLLHFLRASISSSHRGVRRESAWALASLARDAPPIVVQSILQANLLPPLHSMLLHGAYDEQKQAAAALYNLTPAAPLTELLGPDESAKRVLAAYLHLLRVGDPDCCRMALGMVGLCLERGLREGVECVQWVEESDGIDALESTMNRDEGGQLWREAQRLIDRYFEDDGSAEEVGQQQQMHAGDADIPSFRLEAMRRAQQHLQQQNGQHAQ